MEDQKCERKNKWFGACKFEPRYDTTPPAEVPFELAISLDATQNIRALSRREYVCDVCTRCGKTVDRAAAIASREAGKEE